VSVLKRLQRVLDGDVTKDAPVAMVAAMLADEGCVKLLLSRLSGTCVGVLQVALDAATTARQPEITTEHALLGLLDEPSSELARLAAHFKIDDTRCREAIRAHLGTLPRNHAQRPGLSPRLLEWFNRGSTVQSYLGLRALRSGALFACLAKAPSRYVVDS